MDAAKDQPSRDAAFMDLAVQVGEAGRRTAPPNPWVGSVIIDTAGEIAGTGFHERPGTPHAEVQALAAAGERARHGTAYVTLEPCAHHGRTGPCADALVTADVRRVVVAVEDPDPKVSGRGIARLREAGIDVDVGTHGAGARASLAPYLHHRRLGRAFAVLKAAVSMDGRMAATDGSSRWITGPAARADAHELRADSQAVIVGAGTAIADRPTLTVRDATTPIERQPLRVVLDATGRVPATGPLFDPSLAPTLVVTTEVAPASVVDSWQAAGAKVSVLGPGDGGVGVDLVATLELLAANQVLQALVEGGPTLHAGFVHARLAGRFVAYVAGVMLGPDALPMLGLPVAASITTAPRWLLTRVERLENDVRLDYEPERVG